MTTPKKISYGFITLLLVLVCVLHLSTPFITVLFSYFALTKLRFGRGKGLAVTLFVVLVVLFGFGFYYFAKQACVALPRIAAATVPAVIKYAQKYGVELPFSDYAEFKELVREALAAKAVGVGYFAKAVLIEVAAFVIGIVSAVSLFLSARFQLEPEPQSVKNNLYSLAWAEIAERFRTFYASFSTVMGAQILISGINTVLTGIFLLWTGVPYATVLVVVTFLCGLLPIIGNLLSNTLIVGVCLTISLHLALLALVFLIAIHKLEYFLNSKIIGQRIRNPMWLTLLGLIIGEKLMGVPGMILAPVVLHYIKVEASRNKVADAPSESVPQTPQAQPLSRH